MRRELVKALFVTVVGVLVVLVAGPIDTSPGEPLPVCEDGHVYSIPDARLWATCVRDTP